MDLFTAGAETTSTTLTWTLINLIHYPEIQKKDHDEIDHILGSSQPSLEYKGRLVFIYLDSVNCISYLMGLCGPIRIIYLLFRVTDCYTAKLF